MTHLDEGTLQAFLDDELPSPERAAAAEHMMGCGACRTAHDDLRQANAVVSGAVAELDSAAPTDSVPRGGPLRRRRRRGTGSFVKAAVMLLVVAAAASAAVPGSPVWNLIAGALDSPSDPLAVEPAPAAQERPPASPAGVSVLPTGGELVVDVAGMDGTVIRLREGRGEGAAVTAFGATRDPSFRSGPGRLEVRNGAGGELVVELPSSVDSARLVVDGRVAARKVGGELRVLLPAEREDDDVVWR